MNEPLVWNAKDKVGLLLSLVPYIVEHGPTPIVDIAAHFGIPAEQVRKLARFIGTAGIPGESQVSLDNDLFDIDWDALLEDDVLDITRTIAVDEAPRFSGTEAAALLAGLSHLGAILADQSPTLAETALSAAHKIALSTNLSQAEVSIEQVPEAIPALFHRLNEAIGASSDVTFEYADRRGTVTTRTVSPHHLVQGADVWYLRGFCHRRQDERLFRLDRVRHLEFTQGARVRLRPEGGASHESDITHPLNTTVEVLIYPDARYLIEAWSPVLLERHDDGRLLMSIDLAHSGRVIDLVCVAPWSVEVVHPAGLRELIWEWASSLISSTMPPVTMNE